MRQAEKLFAWIFREEDDSSAWIEISNASSLPVSKMILSTVNIQDTSFGGINTPLDMRAFLSLVPPGKFYTRIQIHQGMHFTTGIEIAFTDIDSKSWIRSANGILSEINISPIQYYDLPLPIPWEFPILNII